MDAILYQLLIHHQSRKFHYNFITIESQLRLQSYKRIDHDCNHSIVIKYFLTINKLTLYISITELALYYDIFYKFVIKHMYQNYYDHDVFSSLCAKHLSYNSEDNWVNLLLGKIINSAVNIIDYNWLRL